MTLWLAAIGKDDDSSSGSSPTGSTGSMNEVDGVPRLVGDDDRLDVGRKVDASREQTSRDEDSRTWRWLLVLHRWQSQFLVLILLFLLLAFWVRRLELGNLEKRQDRPRMTSASDARVPGKGDTRDVELFKVSTKVFGLDVFVDEDDDLRVFVSVSSVFDKGPSDFKQDVGSPVTT